MDRTAVAFFEGEFRRYRTLGEGAFNQFGPDQLSAEPLGGLSAATIVWHVAGNLESRFTDFLNSDGEKPWWDRESEFSSRSVSLDEVQEKWDRGWGVLLKELGTLQDSDLTTTLEMAGLTTRR